MERFPCPLLGADVELTDERERHIRERHPDLLPEHRALIAEVLANPDTVRRGARLSNEHRLSKWFDSVRHGKFVVVVIVTSTAPLERHWIVTAYLARKLEGGAAEWTKR